MLEQLKPCPFCGSEAEIVQRQVHLSPPILWYYVECPQCKTQTYVKPTKKDAIDFWNTRFSSNKKASHGCNQ